MDHNMEGPGIIATIILVVIIGIICYNVGLELQSKQGKAAIARMQQQYPDKVYVPIGKWKITTFHAVTAECDSTPNIGSNGRLAIRSVPTGNWFASPVLPFGTKIVIPEVSGHTVWTCIDRMSKRFDYMAKIDLLIHIGDYEFAKPYDVMIVKRIGE